MKKLLATITLLCFSFAASADIYLCTEEKAVSVDRMRVFNPPMRDESETISIFLVDPERGFKRTWIEEDYSGACTIEGNNNVKELNCIQKGSSYANPSTLIMAIEGHDSYYFTYVHQSPFAVYSYAGTCTKV
jgi:hypothetical protein